MQGSSSQGQTLQQSQQQAQHELIESNALHAEKTSSNAALQAQSANLESQLAKLQQTSAGPGPASLHADSAAVLQLLERQLGSLSGALKAKEQQVAALQQTVQQQCDKRALMQIKCLQLEADAKSGGHAVSIFVQSVPAERLALNKRSDASTSQLDTLPKQDSAMSNVSEQGSATGRSKLNRLASASEQQQS